MRTVKIAAIVVVGFVLFLFVWAKVGNLFSSYQDYNANNQSPPAKSEQIVSNSAYDGSVRQVEEWMKKNLNDPGSFQAVEWSKVIKTEQGNYVVRCKFRAKNTMGGLVLQNKAFILGPTGIVMAATDYQ